ncbi:sensor domain-containing protein [Actinacidiphila yeochonensis]|uniref:sensor domain-containing protein n=1 Tax=Actinacidiphila yeochonensis TaxID=89050 RepID=UPI0012FE911D|nr:sensor domain-containing protein [Actinacidiphila yeochonensis]
MIVLTVGSAAACGGGHGHSTAKASAPPASTAPASPSTATSGSPSDSPSGSPSTASAPPSATGSAPISEKQLDRAIDAFGQVESTGLKEDTSQASDGVYTERAKVISGGASCETFLNATEPYAAAYGASAEVDRDYRATTTDGQEEVKVSLVSHTSPAAARRTVEDTRKSAKDCPHLTDGTDGANTRMNLAPLAQPAMGDDSTVVRVGVQAGGDAELTALAVTQVGSVTVQVMTVSGKHYDYGVADEVTKELVGVAGTLSPLLN